MMIDLENINGRSLMCVHFDQIDNPLDFEKLSFLNLIFAGDGQFIAVSSKFGIVMEKIPTIKYKNLALRKYEFDWSFQLFIPKAPKKMFEDILECFKYVNGKINNELLIIIYYDTIDNKHIMDIVKTQIVSGGSVDYVYNKKYEMKDRYIKYLEIHSHNSMTASFSGTDNNDESNRTMYFCGVLGRIDGNSNIYNVDQKFRVWSGLSFKYVDPWEVFEGIEISTPKVSSTNKKVLDQILTVSELAKKNKTQTTLLPSFIPNSNPDDVFRHNPLNRIPPNEVLNGMDDDELDELGIEWDDEEKDLMEQIIDNRRGNAHRSIPPN